MHSLMIWKLLTKPSIFQPSYIDRKIAVSEMKPNAGSQLLSFQLHHSEKSKVNIYRYVQPAMRLDRELKAACVLEQIY